MAYQYGRAREHAYQTFQKELKGETLRSALFFYGKEEYLTRWAVNALVKKYVNPAVRDMDHVRLLGEAVTMGDIRNCCETLPLASERKVVLITDLASLSGEKGKSLSETEEAELGAYLKNLPETTLLIFTAAKADKRKKLYKTLAEVGSVYDFCELPEKNLVSFIQKRLAAAGKTAKASAISAFIGQTGYYDKETDYTLYNVENDVKKAVFHSSGSEVTAADFGATVDGNINANVFAMLDAVSRNRKGDAFCALYRALDSGESVYKILGLICSQFELMLSVRELQDEGRSVSEMQGILDVHEFRIKKAVQFAGGYRIEKLRQILSNAYQVDKNIKKGILEQRLALELFVAQI